MGNEEAENVDNSGTWGTLVTMDAKWTKEIRTPELFYQKDITSDKSLSLKLKKELMKCYIWSIPLYG